VCTCVCVCIHTRIHTHTYVYVCACMRVCTTLIFQRNSDLLLSLLLFKNAYMLINTDNIKFNVTNPCGGTYERDADIWS
jgi:hypothetical protein